MATTEKLFPFFRRAPILIKLRLIFLFLLAIAIVASSSWTVYQIATAEDPGPYKGDISSETTSSPAIQQFTYLYEMKDLSIALTDRRRLRTAYAQFALAFDCPSKDAQTMMGLHRAKILNTINEVAIQFTIDDFKTPLGLQTFKGALKANYKAIFRENAPREIVIRDWLMN